MQTQLVRLVSIPLSALILPAWVETWFRNPEKLNEMTLKVHEVARKTLNLEDVRVATVALPPLPEQEVLVEAVEDQLSVIDHLEADLDTKLQTAQALRQSILRSAFTGQLVPQDPNDEPASELLKRIAAEREERARQAGAAKRKRPGLATGRRRALRSPHVRPA